MRTNQKLRNGDHLARTSGRQYLPVKLIPVLLAAGVASMLYGSPPCPTCGGGRYILPIFCSLLAVFLATVAEVEARPEGVRYRRLLHWKFIPYEQVVSVHRFWSLGTLRCSTWRRPWGIIFFALADSVGFFTFKRNPLLAAIDEGIARDRGTCAVDPGMHHLERGSTVLGFGLTGILLVLLEWFLLPANVTAAALRWPTQAMPQFTYLPAVSVAFAGAWGAFLLVLAWRRYRPRLFAFLGGIGVAWFVLAAPVVFR